MNVESQSIGTRLASASSADSSAESALAKFAVLGAAALVHCVSPSSQFPYGVVGGPIPPPVLCKVHVPSVHL